MIRPYKCLLLAVLSCGRPTEHFRLQLDPSLQSGSSDSAVVKMQTGEIRSIVFALVGSVPGGVTFSAAALPSFATLQGPLLTLSPARADAGEYDVTVIASAGQESASASVHLVVSRTNTAPRLSGWSPPGWTWMRDDRGLHDGTICPGPYCTAYGTPSLAISACDDDGDAVNFEVEVVPRGQPFTGNATYSARSPRSAAPGAGQTSPTPNCGGVTVALTGLSSEQWYQFAVRISDEFGATPTFTAGTGDAHGWMHAPSDWYFEQGPCTATTCACLPAGSFAEQDYQCCSGASDPRDPNFMPFLPPWLALICK